MGRGATHDRGRVADGRRRQHREGDARLCRRAAALRPGGRGRGPRDEPQLCGDRPRAARRGCRLYQHRRWQGDDLPAGRSIGDRPPPGRPDGDPSDGRSAGNALARGAPRLLGQSAAASPGHHRPPPGALQPRSSIDVANGTRRRAGGGGRAAMKCDIAVVGSGLAALVATRTLQQAGRNAVLIWPGLSSLYFTYATVDVLGYSDLSTRQPVEQPQAGVGKLIPDHPKHPYSLVGLDALRSGTTLLIEWLRAAGFTWQGSLARNLLLPTAIGTPKPSCLYPESMAAGDLQRDEPIVFCGFVGYEDF